MERARIIRILILVMAVMLFLSQTTFSAKNDPEDPVHYCEDPRFRITACGLTWDPGQLEWTVNPNEVTCQACKRAPRNDLY